MVLLLFHGLAVIRAAENAILLVASCHDNFYSPYGGFFAPLRALGISC
jgi:hypothetical protein